MRTFFLLLTAALATATPAAAFTVSTDFPGGSAEVKRLDAAAGRLEITPANHVGRGWPCWWYLRIDDAQPGQTLTLQVSAAEQPFRDQQLLPAYWALPYRPAISSDDVHWQQGEPGDVNRQSATYRIVAPASRFWLAWGPPFLPAHADALLESVVRNLPGAQRFVLATTRDGRPVSGIRFGTADASQAIWVQARQHAWEAGSSWVAQGFLQWITSDDPQAVQLRSTTEIFFVPIMDVDSVAIGAGGKEAVPRDHNRDWASTPVYPEVAAAQQRIASLAEAGRLRVFLDLHNPGPGTTQPYYYGPLDYAEMTGRRRANYDRFLQLSIETMTAPLAIDPKFLFATYVKTDEERQRVSGNWVRDHGGENSIALTLETAWNTPHSTIEGYQHVGRGLAKTVTRYLSQMAEE